ncbi:MAG: TraR/DksA family transcriptional regulator [Candidatus Binataceae bacterium]
MEERSKSSDSGRREMLREMLLQLRDETSEKVRQFRRDQAQEAELPPADEMDVARSSAEVETHAGLIARAEEKLRFIDEALSRLYEDQYGICVTCQSPIPFQRLIAVPLAARCVDCQEKQNRAREGWAEGTNIAPYDQQWTLPEEMQEPSDRTYKSTAPEEDLTVRYQRPTGPEEPKPLKRAPKKTSTRRTKRAR